MNIFKTIIAAVMLSSAAALQIEARLTAGAEQAGKLCADGCKYGCSSGGLYCNSGFDGGKGGL